MFSKIKKTKKLKSLENSVNFNRHTKPVPSPTCGILCCDKWRDCPVAVGDESHWPRVALAQSRKSLESHRWRVALAKSRSGGESHSPLQSRASVPETRSGGDRIVGLCLESDTGRESSMPTTAQAERRMP